MSKRNTHPNPSKYFNTGSTFASRVTVSAVKCADANDIEEQVYLAREINTCQGAGPSVSVSLHLRDRHELADLIKDLQACQRWLIANSTERTCRYCGGNGNWGSKCNNCGAGKRKAGEG
jgi:hypothetical protein